MSKKSEITFAKDTRKSGLRPKGGRVTFGRVTVTSAKPQEDVVARNVAQGQTALKRAAEKLYRPGVALRAGKDVPIYYIDDARPKEIVRELNGQKVYGVFRNGRFVVSNG